MKTGHKKGSEFGKTQIQVICCPIRITGDMP